MEPLPTAPDRRGGREASFHRTQRPLEELRHDASLGLRAARGALWVDPVHLQRPPLPSAGLESVKRALVAPKSEQRPSVGLDLHGIVVEISLRSQDPQLAALLI